jgi:aspartate-semialdehyde dehydrogenase
MSIQSMVGFVGWRGMVGSVLLQRMQADNDFADINPIFFSTSNIGGDAPQHLSKTQHKLLDAYCIDSLSQCKAIITCQGGDYTTDVYTKLRQSGWNGYWIDAASTMRMDENAIIVLDPINRNIIDAGLESGIKNYIGGNCTVSLMLMALHGLFEKNLIEWISAATYQAASGGGAANMRELVQQMGYIYEHSKDLLNQPKGCILEFDKQVLNTQLHADFPCTHFGVPLAGNLIPWIDKDLGNGQSKEELKGYLECNKILGKSLTHGTPDNIPIESTCVRIGALRSHSQALTIKLNQDIAITDIEYIIQQANPWVHYVANNKDSSMQELCPTYVSGSLKIAVGRLRKLMMPNMIGLFTVGDQLLWGAAEPLKRMLRILKEHECI